MHSKPDNPLTTLPFLERAPREPLVNAPLLILLHGRAAEAKTIFSIEGFLDPGLHVISIRATYPSALGGYEWFHPIGENEGEDTTDESRFAESESILASQIAAMRRERGLDGNPLFLWGFSQGAAMSFLLGLRGELKPNAVVPMSGFLPGPIESWPAVDGSSKFLIAHGNADEVLSAESSNKAYQALVKRGVEAEYYEYAGRHKMTGICIKHINAWLVGQA